MDGAVDGKTAHMGEHEVGEVNDVERASLGVLRPRLGQRDGEWGGRHGGRAEHGAALVEDSGAGAWKHSTRSAAATP